MKNLPLKDKKQRLSANERKSLGDLFKKHLSRIVHASLFIMGMGSLISPTGGTVLTDSSKQTETKSEKLPEEEPIIAPIFDTDVSLDLNEPGGGVSGPGSQGA